MSQFSYRAERRLAKLEPRFQYLTRLYLSARLRALGKDTVEETDLCEAVKKASATILPPDTSVPTSDLSAFANLDDRKWISADELLDGVHC